MKKRLSTSMTFFWKYIFSIIWLGGFGIGTIGAVSTLGVEGLPFLFGLIFGFVMIYYGCLRAKKVAIDDNFLYVSNFKKNIQDCIEGSSFSAILWQLVLIFIFYLQVKS